MGVATAEMFMGYLPDEAVEESVNGGSVSYTHLELGAARLRNQFLSY